ncbi:DUF397 domain-containing protein [Nocardia sp. NBC_01329]|nr:DUF397 domain-containing protein [Nocardia sp. NBC_01329]
MNVEFSDVQWFKSSHSGNDECVEVAWLDSGRVGVRDSKYSDGPVLRFTSTEWGAFTSALRGSCSRWR